MPYKDKEKKKEWYRKWYYEKGGKERDSARHKIYYNKNREKILTKKRGGCDLDCENCKYDDCINDKVRTYTLRKDMSPEKLEKERAYHREYKRKRIEDARAKGLCTNCFTKPKMDGFVRCYECYLKYKRYRQRYLKHKREQWQEEGLCTICGEKRFSNKKVCEKHYKMLCASIEKAHKHPNTHAEREKFRKIIFGGGKE